MAQNLECAACNEPITAQYATIDGKPYHGECFICTECRAPVSSENRQVDEDINCVVIVYTRTSVLEYVLDSYLLKRYTPLHLL